MSVRHSPTRKLRHYITDHVLEQVRDRCRAKTISESDVNLRHAVDEAIGQSKVEYWYDTSARRPFLLVNVSDVFPGCVLVGCKNNRAGYESQDAFVTCLTVQMVESNIRQGLYIESALEEYSMKVAKLTRPSPPSPESTPLLAPPATPVAPKVLLRDDEDVVVLRGECEFRKCKLAEAKQLVGDDPATRIFRELKTRRQVSVELEVA